VRKLPIYWIWFAQLKGINLWTKRQLLETFRDPDELFRLEEKALQDFPKEVADALQNKDLTESQKSFAMPTPTANDYRDKGLNNESQEVVFMSMNLDLKDKVNNEIKINTKNLTSATVEELTAVVVNKVTGEKLCTIKGSEFVDFGEGIYYIDVVDVEPKNMRVLYTVQVFAGEEALSSEYTFSTESYVGAAIAANHPAKDVVTAALLYGDAAAKLFS
jgi:hypothetical protein